MKKFRKCILISIIILICVNFREISAQNSRSNRKKSNVNNSLQNTGFNHRINQDTNNGLSPQNLQQKRPGSGQKRRSKNNHRHDHG